MSCAGGWGSSVLTKTKFLGGKYNINLTQKKIKRTDIFPVKPVVFQYQDNSRWHDLWTCFYVTLKSANSDRVLLDYSWRLRPPAQLSSFPSATLQTDGPNFSGYYFKWFILVPVLACGKPSQVWTQKVQWSFYWLPEAWTLPFSTLK